jgi:hypothetical protein
METGRAETKVDRAFLYVFQMLYAFPTLYKLGDSILLQKRSRRAARFIQKEFVPYPYQESFADES